MLGYKMSSKKKTPGKNTKKKLNGLPENKKNKTWTDKEMNLCAHVLANTDALEHSWLYQLENYALKKHANEQLFLKIQEEFGDAFEEDSVEYRFTIEQLRTKYKWFKREWRQIDHKIKSGTGLGGKDTSSPNWYDVLNPHFCQAVEDMTSVLTKANDLCNSSDEDQSESDNSDSEISNNNLNTSLELDPGHLINTSGEMSDNSSKSSLASSSTKAANVDDMEESEGSSKAASRVKKLTKKSPKKTNIKFHSRRNSKPKSESEALVQVAKSIEHSSIQQEKNKDSRLQALLEADKM